MDAFKTHIFQKPLVPKKERPVKAEGEGASVSLPEQLPTLKEVEHLLVDEAMRRAGGNQSFAALSLGITRQALNKRVRKE